MKRRLKAELQARIVPAQVEPSRGAEVLRDATSRVSAKARIDFCRDVRKC
jgi:hypothetical protein